MRIMLANEDKAHRCPAWSVGKNIGSGKCPSGSLTGASVMWDYGRDPRHMFLKCKECGTWRAPTFGVRAFFDFKYRLRKWKQDREYNRRWK